MLKGILKYSITALWVIIAELFPSIVCFDKYAIAILLFITPPNAILATGAVRFYRKRSTDSKRLLKSIIFFIASLILTSGLAYALFMLIFMTLWGPAGSTILVLFPLVLGTVLAYGISINRGSKHSTKRYHCTCVYL